MGPGTMKTVSSDDSVPSAVGGGRSSNARVGLNPIVDDELVEELESGVRE